MATEVVGVSVGHTPSDLFQRPGIAATVRFDEIHCHYFCAHPMINPTEIVAVQPAGDWSPAHGRGRLSA